jgi:hypothetical protein
LSFSSSVFPACAESSLGCAWQLRAAEVDLIGTREWLACDV